MFIEGIEIYDTQLTIGYDPKNKNMTILPSIIAEKLSYELLLEKGIVAEIGSNQILLRFND